MPGLAELGAAFSELFKKISDIFDVFDLSFFVSGALLLAAAAFWDPVAPGWLDQARGSTLGILVLVAGTYVSGLVSFAVGRFARRNLIRLGRLLVTTDENATRKGPRAAGANDTHLQHVLQNHGFTFDPMLARYADLDGGWWRLYVRMWAKLRDASAIRESYTFVRRQWVLAATYDGVATSCVVWAIVIWRRLGYGLTEALICGGVAAFVFAACISETQRLTRNQVEEVAATIANLPLADRSFGEAPAAGAPAVAVLAPEPAPARPAARPPF